MQRLVLIALCLVALAGCERTVGVQIARIEKTDAYPLERYDFNLPHESPRSVRGSQSGFVRITFTADVDLQLEAQNRGLVYVRYELSPCGHEDVFRESGDIFPVSSETGNTYEAFIPANAELLGVEASGSERGWPTRLRDEGLCFVVRGHNMAGGGLRSRPVRVDEVNALIWPIERPR
jgi:hypothetical protein